MTDNIVIGGLLGIIVGCVLAWFILPIQDRILALRFAKQMDGFDLKVRQRHVVGDFPTKPKHRALRALDRGLPRGAMTQAAILILGAVSAALIAWGDASARWGFPLALAGQPFWIVSTWRARQWGMCILSCVYTGVWAMGAWRVWGGIYGR